MPRNFNPREQRYRVLEIASMRPRQMPRNFILEILCYCCIINASMRPRQMPRNFVRIGSFTALIAWLQ